MCHSKNMRSLIIVYRPWLRVQQRKCAEVLASRRYERRTDIGTNKGGALHFRKIAEPRVQRGVGHFQQIILQNRVLAKTCGRHPGQAIFAFKPDIAIVVPGNYCHGHAGQVHGETQHICQIRRCTWILATQAHDSFPDNVRLNTIETLSNYHYYIAADNDSRNKWPA
jgi:hypothetical protein